MKWREVGRLNPFHVAGLLHQEIGNLVVLSLYIWCLNGVVFVVWRCLQTEERVYLVDGITQPVKAVPYLGPKS